MKLGIEELAELAIDSETTLARQMAVEMLMIEIKELKYRLELMREELTQAQEKRPLFALKPLFIET